MPGLWKTTASESSGEFMKSTCVIAIVGLAVTTQADTAQAAAFEWFEYTGRDDIHSAPLPARSFHNPSTEVAGGFVGTVLSPFARQE